MGNAVAEPRTLFLHVGRHRWPVASLADASLKYRATIDAMGVGASKAPRATIKDEGGKYVGHVSFNGRVWASRPGKFDPKEMPLYDSCKPGASLDQAAALRRTA